MLRRSAEGATGSASPRLVDTQTLLRDGAIKVEDVRAVTDFYLAAEEMNRCLDSANDIAMGEGHSGEVRESLLL